MSAITPPETGPLIEFENVGVYQHQCWLVRAISFALQPAQILTLIGPNGSGKSTTARLALGLLRCNTGQITRRPGLRVGYVPQKFALDWTLPLSVARFMTLTEPCPDARVRDALAKTGALDLLDAQLGHLSGGQLQRVLLARALARRPNLLVLDEPVQGVDYNGELEIYALIQEIRDQERCGILLISHDLHVVMAATDHVVCLNGHVCCQGSPASVSADPAYQRLFAAKGDAALALYTHNHDHTHLPDGSIHTSSTCDHTHHAG